MIKFLRSLRLSWILLAVVFLLIFLKLVGVLSPVEALIVRALSPFQHGVYSAGVGINSLYSNLVGSDDAAAENKRLREEVETLTVERTELMIEVEELRSLLDEQTFLRERNLESVPARIVGQNPQPDFQSIILDQGSRAGVKVDQPIIAQRGVIVGKIFSVDDHSSEALLISDPRIRVAAEIQNEAGSRGVIVGEHGLSLRMELIPQNEMVETGDLVITSGIEPTITRGLVIGKVVRVESESNALFQTVYVKSLVTIDDLTVVSILTSL